MFPSVFCERHLESFRSSRLIFITCSVFHVVYPLGIQITFPTDRTQPIMGIGKIGLLELSLDFLVTACLHLSFTSALIERLVRLVLDNDGHSSFPTARWQKVAALCSQPLDARWTKVRSEFSMENY